MCVCVRVCVFVLVRARVCVCGKFQRLVLILEGRDIPTLLCNKLLDVYPYLCNDKGVT